MKTSLKKFQKTFAQLMFGQIMLCLLLPHLLGHIAAGQTPSTAGTGAVPAASALPRMVRFSGTAKDINGFRLSGPIGITFSLYLEQTGGAPLWLETQNVQADGSGHYSVLLGSTKPEGLPAELFTSEQAHWVGVQVSGQPDQPRVLLVSAPYALKAGDAETLGGFRPSAFVLASSLNGIAAATSHESIAGANAAPPTALDVTTTGGTANYLPLFNGTSTVLDSVMFQSGTGTTAKIGINTTTPVSTLDVKGGGTIRGILTLPVTGTATATAGKNSQPLSLTASAYNSSTPAAVNQTFRWQAEPSGNDTATPSGTLNLLFGEGTATPTETGLHIASNGQITFAAGQTFPGAGGGGTVTSVATGPGLTGGPITGSGTLSIATGGVTNAMLANSYAQLGAANTFTGNQTLNGTITATSSGDSVVGNSSGTSSAGVEGNGVIVGVVGQASATSLSPIGVWGIINADDGGGVQGLSQSTTGTATGVTGSAKSPTGYGIFGQNLATSGNAVGVYGLTSSPNGYGVEGAGDSIGVYGTSSAIGGQGVLGEALSTTGVVDGVSGVTFSPGGYGVYGSVLATSGTTSGVQGVTQSTSGSGVQGMNLATTGSNYGVYGSSASDSGLGVMGTSPFVGVYAQSAGASNEGALVGILGSAVNAVGLWGDTGGVSGFYTAVVGTADDNGAGAFFNNGSTRRGTTLYLENDTTVDDSQVFAAYMPNLLGSSAAAIIGDPGCSENAGNMALQLGQDFMTGCTNYTLLGNDVGDTYLNAVSGETLHLRIANVDQLTITTGKVDVVGTLSKGGGSFKIDHPLDPANKYLYHSFVESPDMMNIYNGNVTTGADGLAMVTMPDWFEALNTDFRYQLTVMGQFAQAIVASEMSGNQFSIRTDKPNVKVSWQVTGVRHDAFANANRIPVEVEKASADRGRYLYPEAIGQPASARIGYEAPPPARAHVAGPRQILPRSGEISRMPERMPLNQPVAQRANLPRPVVPQLLPTPRLTPPPHSPAQANPKMAAPLAPPIRAAAQPLAAPPK